MRNKMLWSFLLLLFYACQPQQEETTTTPILDKQGVMASGTQAMIDSLEAIKQRTDFRKHPYESAEKLKLIQKEVDEAQAQQNLSPQLLVEYGLTLLNAGQTEKAIALFENVLDQLPQNKVINQQTKTIHETLAICYLRLGEQTNCIQNHSNEACLFPIQGKGVHINQEGSRKAIEIYKQILEVFPDDLRSRWLLNIAYMTIDEHPEKVPEKFLFPPSLFHPEFDIPPFENIATPLGVDINDLAGGVMLDDFNNDGWIDILTSSWSMSGQLRFFISDGEGQYVDHTKAAGLEGITGGLNLIQGDYNNDGHLDFYIIRGAWRILGWMGQMPNALIKNNGDGTFTDVTIASGLYAQHPTQSAVWLDFNADGWLDLFVGNEAVSPREKHPSQLFLNQGNGTFVDVAPNLGLTIDKYVKGVTAGDINNDGWPDIYVSVINGANHLFVNRGGTTIEDWRFEDITTKAGVGEPLESFPTWFFDYDNDGWEDLFVACFDQYALKQQSREVAANYLGLPVNSDWPRLYRNRGNEQFDNVTKAVNLERILPTMGCNYGDLDNDGFPDFYLGTGAPDFRAIVPNRMFRNNAGKSFQDVTYAGKFGHIQKGHGIAFADLDSDGDQDIYAVMGGSVSGDVFQNALFENPGNNHNWIIVRLKGVSSNRSAIGARLKITVEQEDGVLRDIYNTVNSGGSFGANSLQQEVGLGTGTKISNIAVDWPDAKPGYINYGSVTPNQIIEIEEGKEDLKQKGTKSFAFAKKQNGYEHRH